MNQRQAAVVVQRQWGVLVTLLMTHHERSPLHCRSVRRHARLRGYDVIVLLNVLSVLQVCNY